MKTAEEVAEDLCMEFWPDGPCAREKKILIRDITAYVEERLKNQAEYAARVVRDSALEEAADICDQESTVEGIAQKCATRLRALKGKA